MYGELTLPHFFSLLLILKPRLFLVSIQQDPADTSKLNHNAVSPVEPFTIIHHGEPLCLRAEEFSTTGSGYDFTDIIHSKSELLLMCTFFLNSASSKLLLRVIYRVGTKRVTL